MVLATTGQTYSTDLSPRLACHIDGSQRRPKWLLQNNRKFRYLYVNNVLELLKAHDVSFQILNLHEPEPLLVTFFCHVLPAAEANCAVSRQLAVNGVSEKRANRERLAIFWQPLRPGRTRRSGVWTRHVVGGEHHWCLERYTIYPVVSNRT
jgi:hypothetical protein